MTRRREPQDLTCSASTYEAREREVRRRVAWFARQRFSRDAEKLLQRELDISESSAERILAGNASNNLINRMHAAWGWAFSTFVLQPLAGPFTPTSVDRSLEVIEQHATAVLEWTTKARTEALARLAADRGAVPDPRAGLGDRVAGPAGPEEAPHQVAATPRRQVAR